MLFWTFFRDKINTKAIVRKLFIFLLPFIILAAPLNLYFSKNTDNRIYEQFFLQSEKLSISEKTSFLSQNLKSIASMFLIKGDPNGRHNYPGKPMLNPILGIFFIIGFIKTILNFKKFPNNLFLIYFFIGILPPLLTYPWENPNALRAITILPSIIYFVAQAIISVFQITKFNKYVLVAIFILFGLSALYEIRTYYNYQVKVFPISFELDPKLLEKYLDGSYIYKSTKNKI